MKIFLADYIPWSITADAMKAFSGPGMSVLHAFYTAADAVS
jgi:hypothetical protein